MRLSKQHAAIRMGCVLLVWLSMTATMMMPATASAKAEESGVCENNSEMTSSCLPRAPPRILANGSFQDLEGLTAFKDITTISYDTLLDGTHRKNKKRNSSGSIAAIPGGETIDLRYVKDLLAPETASALIASCDKRSGWTTSPQSVDGTAKVKASRTSRSCPLIWPQLYLPLLDNPAYGPRLEASGLKDEIDLTWRLTQRISQLLGVEEEFVEPFQLVRYQPGEFYREHHDHGSYYGANTEQRPLTLLVFLSDIPSTDGAGGYTKFRALGDAGSGGVSVVPRLGDGVLWKNEDGNGELLLDAVHEAVPPGDGGEIIKYAMNVWIAKKKIQDNMDVSAYRTK
mmetsp:Transcript_31131/g.65266  ORF Transcript_31131/g.65266 Transcript_31131/m.65266 type:complete len:342 (+) Transcript_31131:280-1305(+)